MDGRFLHTTGHASGEVTDDSPIFIVGANRSGTTLLRLILNAHSRISIPEELVYFRSSIAHRAVKDWQCTDLRRDRYEALVNRFLKNNCRVLEGIDRSEIKRKILNQGVYDLKQPYATVLKEWAHLQGKPRWGEKTPGNLFYSDILYEMFPKARFIHLVRDPRAGVCSMQQVSFFPDDVVFNALNRRKHMKAARSILETSVPDKQRLTITYEDLVRSPEETIRKVCSFIEEQYEPSMLEYYANARDHMKSEAIMDFNSSATNPVTSSHIEKWRATLTRDETAVIEWICKSEMSEFGYKPEGHRPTLRCFILMIVKISYWYVQSWRNRRQRHYTVRNRPFARTEARLMRWRNEILAADLG